MAMINREKTSIIKSLINYFFYFSGGPESFSEVVWDVARRHNDKHITFTYNSFDGEEGNVSFHG
jgi:hypothetical protein